MQVFDKHIMDLNLFNYILECLYLPQPCNIYVMKSAKFDTMMMIKHRLIK